MTWANAQYLYKFIKENPVKRVLDLGTGIGASAAVMALAFQDKGETDYHIDTVEQYDKCVRLANQLIPEELRKNISFHEVKPTVWEHEKIPYQYFSIYQTLPEGEYDLIVNDGPAPWLDEKKGYVDLPNGTIHKLVSEGKLKPGTKVVYDGRLTSLKLLERYFAGNFTLNFVPPRGMDFYVLERKENELEVKDERYHEVEKQTPYFKNHQVETKEELKHEDTLPINEQSPPSEATDTAQGA